MPIEARIDIQPSELAQIVQSVFRAMLSLEWGMRDTLVSRGNRLTSAVHLAGDWSGALLLECNHARPATSPDATSPSNSPASVDDVVRDVLGELANMIGGNMKCAMIPGLPVHAQCGRRQ